MPICANKAFHKKLQYPFERNSFIVTTSLLRFTSMLPRVAYFPSILTKFHNFLQKVLLKAASQYNSKRIGQFFSPGMSDQKLDEMIAKADVDNNGWVGLEDQHSEMFSQHRQLQGVCQDDVLLSGLFFSLISLLQIKCGFRQCIFCIQNGNWNL